MKKALISPIEPYESGYRVAEVKNETHEMAAPFFWVDCSDDVIADQFWYDPNDETFKQISIRPMEQPRTSGAQTL
jgi:hypothetical protein